MHSLHLRTIRHLFGIAEHVAPRLAGRAAFALFCRTPDPERTSLRAREALEAARPFMEDARRHHLTSGYGSFICHEFRPAYGGTGLAAVLVIHGWGSRTEHLRPIVEALRGRGLRVLALDLPGHGQSSGRTLNMAKAVAAVKAVEEWFAPISTIVGHSLGGAVAVNALAGSVRGVNPVRAHRLVLIATPNSMRPLFETTAWQLGLGPRTRQAFFDEVERVTGNPLSAFVGTRQAAELSISMLVLHAPDDREVAPSDAEDFAAAGPHVQRRWIPGAGHRRILSDSRAIVLISAFALGAPLPSVAVTQQASENINS